jgi:hypothetical protein
VTPVRNPKEETMAQLTTLEEKLAGEKDPCEES